MKLVPNPGFIKGHVLDRFEWYTGRKIIQLSINDIPDISPLDPFHHFHIGGGIAYLESEYQTSISIKGMTYSFYPFTTIYIQGHWFFTINMLSGSHSRFYKTRVCISRGRYQN